MAGEFRFRFGIGFLAGVYGLGAGFKFASARFDREREGRREGVRERGQEGGVYGVTCFLHRNSLRRIHVKKMTENTWTLFPNLSLSLSLTHTRDTPG